MQNTDDSLPPNAQTIQRAFKALIDVLNERKIRYAIIGGLAVMQHTRVRTTDDIDALLIVPQIALPSFFERLRERGFSVEVMKNVRELRDGGMTAIGFENVTVDLMRPVLPIYARVLERALDARILELPVRVSSAESLIVMKMISFRPQDQTDIRDLLASYRSDLDLAYVRGELDGVMNADDPRRAMLESWIREAGA